MGEELASEAEKLPVIMTEDPRVTLAPEALAGEPVISGTRLESDILGITQVSP